MKTVKLLHTPGAELEATAPRQRRCGGAAASASAGVRAQWEALRKIGNEYSRDSRTQGGEVLPVSCKTAALATCLCLADEQRLPAPKCHLLVCSRCYLPVYPT